MVRRIVQIQKRNQPLSKSPGEEGELEFDLPPAYEDFNNELQSFL
jgi:hypothetical protein